MRSLLVPKARTRIVLMARFVLASNVDTISNNKQHETKQNQSSLFLE